MQAIILISILTFYAIVIVVSVFLKRNYKINYDRRTLFSGLLLILVCGGIFLWGDISEKPTVLTDNKIKYSWLILIASFTYAIGHFLSWLTFALGRKFRFVKIPRFIFNVSTTLIVIVVTLYTAKYFFDLNLSALLVTSTVLSAIIGLSLQDTLSNLFAGLSLQMETPFVMDEWVNLGGHEGKVVDQSWRSLTIQTRENHRIVLPNKVVSEERIINYSRPSSRQIHSFNVDLDYSHPPNQVKNILRKLLNDMPEVEIDDIAYPYLVGYAESGITYCLKFWIIDYAEVPHVQNDILTRLWYALDRNSIKIPYPHTEVHMAVISDESEQVNEKNKNQELLLKLREQKWLSDLPDKHLVALAEHARISRFAKHDNLVVADTLGDAMYIITEGSASVLIQGDKDTEIHVADKNTGDFFGEMSLLTGDPTTATVRAKEDMEVIVVNKKGFTKVLMGESNILELFVTALESNQSKLTDIIEEARKNADSNEVSARKILMSKIRAYFELD